MTPQAPEDRRLYRRAILPRLWLRLSVGTHCSRPHRSEPLPIPLLFAIISTQVIALLMCVLAACPVDPLDFDRVWCIQMLSGDPWSASARRTMERGCATYVGWVITGAVSHPQMSSGGVSAVSMQRRHACLLSGGRVGSSNVSGA